MILLELRIVLFGLDNKNNRYLHYIIFDISKR